MAAKVRSFVVGTAGHIDHGKTSLVKALTGTETDQLPEEKERGITISLGFAPWKVAKDLQASIVDVPGHEGFVRTMVAGAFGLDIVIFVISAEDGVMPQTREHLNICRLLDISKAVIALTKIDRLDGDEEAIELASEDVRDTLANTPFAEAPIVPLSAHTGEGIDDLKRTVAKLIRETQRRETKGAVILPIDRAFTMKGHGTVVTGTLMAGSIFLNRDIDLRLFSGSHPNLPKDVRARAAQVRGDTADSVSAGTRTALNLGKIALSEVSRGDVITAGDHVHCTDVFHAHLEHLEHDAAPWKSGNKVQICAATSNVVGTIDPLFVNDSDNKTSTVAKGSKIEIPPGQSGYIRIRTDKPIPVWRNQKIVIRGFGGVESVVTRHGMTTGGGWVVDPLPSSGRKQRPRWVVLGQSLNKQPYLQQILALIQDAASRTIDERELELRTGAPHLAQSLETLGSSIAQVGTSRWVASEEIDKHLPAIVDYLNTFHRDHPLQPGVGRATLDGCLPPFVHTNLREQVIDTSIERGLVLVADASGNLCLPGKGPLDPNNLPPQLQGIYDLYVKGGLTPPSLKEVQSACQLTDKRMIELVKLLQHAKLLERVSDDLSFTSQAHDSVVAQVRIHLAEHGEVDVQVLKALTGLSRKFVVPLLEHFDSLSITRRDGDRRVPGPRAKA